MHRDALKELPPGNPGSERARWVHRDGMSALSKRLAADSTGTIDPAAVCCSSRVIAVRAAAGSAHWALERETGDPVTASLVLVTAPVPQALELFSKSGLTPEAGQAAALNKLGYDPCFALTVTGVLPEVSKFAAGSLPIWKGPHSEGDEPILEGIYDQRGKGLSCSHPTWVIHAAADWSQKHWQDADGEVVARLIKATGSVLGLSMGDLGAAAVALHRWRYAAPRSIANNLYWEAEWADRPRPALLLAGDGFGGGSVEGAFLSGSAAGARLAALSKSRVARSPSPE